MVRINIINPKFLTDQHLIAEYLEILMLVGSAKNNYDKNKVPEIYCLGKGHINFFKNKLVYLKRRHEQLKKEMRRRGFKTNISLNIKNLKKEMLCDWKPSKKDKSLIKKRLIYKINLKPNFYRYYKKKKSKSFLVKMTKKAN